MRRSVSSISHAVRRRCHEHLVETPDCSEGFHRGLEQIGDAIFDQIVEAIRSSVLGRAAKREKYTSQDLYASIAPQIYSVYFQCYQLAYDLAKRAERTFQRELGLDSSNFIQSGYWDSLEKGLLAGEHMSMDIRRTIRPPPNLCLTHRLQGAIRSSHVFTQPRSIPEVA